MNHLGLFFIIIKILIYLRCNRSPKVSGTTCLEIFHLMSSGFWQNLQLQWGTFFFFHNDYHSHYHRRLIQQLAGLHMVIFLKWNLSSYVTVNWSFIGSLCIYTDNLSQSCIYVWICNSKQNLITNKEEMKMKISISNLYIFEKIHRIIEHKMIKLT